MTRRRPSFILLFLIFYMIIILLINDPVWSWLMLVGLTFMFSVRIPPSLFHRLGRVVGRVQRKVERRRQRSRSGVHEAERSYEQGYQANFSNGAQEFLSSEDAYELPQAQYPQQQLPPI